MNTAAVNTPVSAQAAGTGISADSKTADVGNSFQSVLDGQMADGSSESGNGGNLDLAAMLQGSALIMGMIPLAMTQNTDETGENTATLQNAAVTESLNEAGVSTELGQAIMVGSSEDAAVSEAAAQTAAQTGTKETQSFAQALAGQEQVVTTPNGVEKQQQNGAEQVESNVKPEEEKLPVQPLSADQREKHSEGGPMSDSQKSLAEMLPTSEAAQSGPASRGEEAAQMRVNFPEQMQKVTGEHQAAKQEIRPFREQIFSGVNETLKVIHQPGSKEVTIHLQPDFLGRLNLKVAVEDGVVTARFLAENSQVKALIEGALPQLRQTLQEMGYKSERMEVGVGQNPTAGGFEQNFQQQSQEPEKQFKQRQQQGPVLVENEPLAVEGAVYQPVRNVQAEFSHDDDVVESSIEYIA